MVSTSSRLSLVALTLYLTSAVLAKPYAPDLYSRSDLLQDGTEKRHNSASRPYAPDLFARNRDDPIQVVKRSTSSDMSSSWSPLDFLSKRSEEELHIRGKVDDALIEKRGRCTKDSQCGSRYYCSTQRNQCYQLLNTGTRCTRDGACSTGYCCETTNKCKEQKSVGQTCHSNNGACSSGYCSVSSNTCRQQASKGERCAVDDGCSGSLSCVNGSCKSATKPNHSTSPSKPTHTSSPSGSAQHKRVLQSL